MTKQLMQMITDARVEAAELRKTMGPAAAVAVLRWPNLVAGVAQVVERSPSKSDVARSTRVTRSKQTP